MIDWLKDHEVIGYWFIGLTVVVLIASMIIGPMMILRIPPDYFAHDKRPKGFLEKYPPAVRMVLKVAKNILGGVMMLAGLAMLALPGQGLLTLLLGFLLIDLPGKYRMEKWMISRKRVLKAINWYRKKKKREPLRVESDESDHSDDTEDSSDPGNPQVTPSP